MNTLSKPWLSSLRALAIAFLCVAFNAAQANAQSLLRDTEIEETLREFTDPILRAGGLTPSSVDIYIVNDSSLNAFVTRGQNIFLHSGLILRADTPNQLKGVIAHETGHITGGHIVRSDYGNRSAYGAMLIAAGIGLAAILAGEAEAGALVLGGSQQFGALEALSYSRVNESAADQYAFEYMDRTGQSSAGLIQFFEKFRAQEVISQARRYPYFRGHPLSSDRIGALRERVRDSEHSDKKDTDEEIHKLKMVQAKLRGFLDGPAQIYGRFPKEDQSQPARYARAVANFKQADLKNAIKEIDSLIEEEPQNPYFHELKAQILYESGQGVESIAPARRALELKPDSALLQIALAQAILETRDSGDYSKAQDLIKSALRSEPTNSFAWYLLADIYERQGETSLAKYATAERFYAVGNMQSARSFAQRAQEELSRTLPQWRRASDIIIVADTQIIKKNGRNRGPKPLVSLRSR